MRAGVFGHVRLPIFTLLEFTNIYPCILHALMAFGRPLLTFINSVAVEIDTRNEDFSGSTMGLVTLLFNLLRIRVKIDTVPEDGTWTVKAKWIARLMAKYVIFYYV